jgi:hypothetical protein
VTEVSFWATCMMIPARGLGKSLGFITVDLHWWELELHKTGVG